MNGLREAVARVVPIGSCKSHPMATVCDLRAVVSFYLSCRVACQLQILFDALSV